MGTPSFAFFAKGGTRIHLKTGERSVCRRIFDLLPTLNLLMQRESRWQSCLKIDLLSADGVLEIQKLGMQEISSIAREAGEIFKRLAR
jgi:hypothetical protein